MIEYYSATTDYSLEKRQFLTVARLLQKNTQ